MDTNAKGKGKFKMEIIGHISINKYIVDNLTIPVESGNGVGEFNSGAGGWYNGDGKGAGDVCDADYSSGDGYGHGEGWGYANGDGHGHGYGKGWGSSHGDSE